MPFTYTPAELVEIALSSYTTTERKAARFRRFYEGFQEVKHTDRQNKYLDTPGTDYPDSFFNICSLVIGVVNDRLKIKPDGRGIVAGGIVAGDSESGTGFADKATEWWIDNDLNSEQTEVHRLTLRDVAAAMIVEWNQAENRPVFKCNPIIGQGDSMGVRFHLDNNDEVIFVSKQWVDQDLLDSNQQEGRLTIYERGQITRYRFDPSGGHESAVLIDPAQLSDETGGAITENPQPYPLDLIPVVMFENFPQVCEFEDVLKIQRVLNHNLGNIDTAIDYHAYPMLTAEQFNDDAASIGPQQMLVGQGVQRVPPPDLDPMWKGGVKDWLRLVALTKRWPVWVLDPDGGAIPSGEALRRAEAALVSQIEDKQKYFDRAWQEAFWIAKELHNYFNKSAPIEGEIKLVWEYAGTKNPNDTGIEVTTAIAAGWSHETIWREIYGWSEERVEKEKERLLEQEAMGIGDFTPPEGGAAPVPVEDDPQPAEQAAIDGAIEANPDLALNGAQVKAALDIVAAVARKEIPYTAGLNSLEILFNLNTEQAQRLLAGVEQTRPQNNGPVTTPVA